MPKELVKPSIAWRAWTAQEFDLHLGSPTENIRLGTSWRRSYESGATFGISDVLDDVCSGERNG